MKLPSSWVEVTLGDLLTRSSEKVNPQDSERKNHFYIGLEHIESHTGRLLLHSDDLTETASIRSIKSVFHEGDILYGKLRPNLNKVYLAEKSGICSTDIWALRPNNLILPEYALSFLSSVSVYKRATQLATGANLPRVSASSFDRIKIPLPTIYEQQRIVYLLQQIQKIQDLRKHTADLINRTKNQLFIEMFGLPNPKQNSKWPIAKLGNVVSVATGGTPSRQQDDNYLGNVAWVKSTDLKDTVITSPEEYVSEIGIQRSNAKVYPKNTIMIAMYGQGQTRGRTGKILIEASCNQACAALLPSEELHHDYLWTWFQLSYYFVRSLGRGAQLANLNLDIVRNIHIPKPPIKLQIEFSRRLTQLLEVENSSNSMKFKMEEAVEALKIEALTGEATSIWREQHAEVINKTIAERNQLLREVGVKASNIKSKKEKKVETKSIASNKSRQWLTKELSEFQRQVLAAFQIYEAQPLLSEDAELFAQFCDSDEITERLEKFGPSINNRIRRTLSQLASMGLIAKITLPQNIQETGEREYLKAFRPLREDEYTRLKDISNLRNYLSIEEKNYFFTVVQDFETSKGAGAEGLFQVISLIDSDDNDRTELVDVGQHYQSIEELRQDLAKHLMIKIEQIELETD